MQKQFLFTGLLLGILLIACQKQELLQPVTSQNPVFNAKDPNTSGTPSTNGLGSLSYGDTIFYLSATGTNIISPVNFTGFGKGEFKGFPGGLEIDSLTGAINISESETGLRYKVMFLPFKSKDTIITKIVLSGINFYDHIFHFSKGDTVANSIYNASGIAFVPGQFGVGTGCSFDDGGGCKAQGVIISNFDGSINLAQTLRAGAIPQLNNSVGEFLYNYKMDDKSGLATNHLKVKIYFYQTEHDIPSYLWDILLKERQGVIIPALASSGFRAKTQTARPPCLIIVMN